jgi:hypothetical protein
MDTVEVPRDCPPVPTSLAHIDAEIERVTGQIVKLQEKELHVVSQPMKKTERENPTLIFHDLPDIQNIEIPTGFQRAPITFNYDPTKAEKLAQLEDKLKNLLEDERDRDVKDLVKKIRDHQAANPIRGISGGSIAKEQRPLPNEKQLIGYLLPDYVLIRNP